MESVLQVNSISQEINSRDQKVNYIQKGAGIPVLLIHGIAASLHDWDELIPELAAGGYAAYALDLLGHGKSGKPDVRTYQIDWLFEHFTGWIDSLHLTQPPVLCGHSLGGYLSLEYARRFPARTLGLILSNPYFHLGQLSTLIRLSYRRPYLNGRIIERIPHWMFRVIIDGTSRAAGRTNGTTHALPEKVRRQMIIDYKRTAPGVYHLPNTAVDLTEYLPRINVPALILWGDRDLTLAPQSFPRLVEAMPRATGKVISGAGHVPHQSNAVEYNRIVLEYLKQLPVA